MILGANQESDGNLDLMKILFRNKIQRMLLENPPMQAPVQQKDFPTPPEMMAQAKQKQAVQAEQMAKEGGGKSVEGEADRAAPQAQAPQKTSTGDDPNAEMRFQLQGLPTQPKAPFQGTEKDLPGPQMNPQVQAMEEQARKERLNDVPQQVQPKVAPIQQQRMDIQETPPYNVPHGASEYDRPIEDRPLPQAIVAPYEAQATTATVPPDRYEQMKQAQEAEAHEMPLRQDYPKHPGRARHFADILAGISVGFMSRNPWYGMQMTKDLDEGAVGYRRDLENWKQKYGQVKSMADVEGEISQHEIEKEKIRLEDERLRSLQHHQAAQEKEWTSLAHRADVQAAGMPQSFEESIRGKEDVAAAGAQARAQMQASTRPVTIVTKDGQRLPGYTYDPVTHQYIGPPKEPGGPPVRIKNPQQFISQVIQEGKAPMKLEDYAAFQEQGYLKRELSPDELADIHKSFATGLAADPLYESARRTGEQARAGKAVKELDAINKSMEPETIRATSDAIVANATVAQDKTRVTKFNYSQINEDLLHRWGVRLPTKPQTPTAPSQFYNSVRALQYVYSIEQLIRQDPRLLNYLGPLAGGVIAHAEQKIGTSLIAGAPKDLQESLSELQTRIGLLWSAETAAQSQRGATQYMATMLKDITPDMRMTPERFEGAMRGVKGAATDNIKAYGISTFGSDFVKKTRNGKQVPQVTNIDGEMAAWNAEADAYQVGGLE